ncbi:MAG: hypothetical protein JO171_16220 [Paludibacterium sp.]|uniref:hypothetical protein n=1 Tax=Paludibacterium sp. TaxID=1917523 RepID=UPI0025E2940D|nr:hypothetical protein [Paludibacterium sp.]MBV8048695.1 hypothetical protein [Paludibacterium sp.]MBV8646910.1 hypothetical protein [Paludibacterium sp.]
MHTLTLLQLKAVSGGKAQGDYSGPGGYPASTGQQQTQRGPSPANSNFEPRGGVKNR